MKQKAKTTNQEIKFEWIERYSIFDLCFMLLASWLNGFQLMLQQLSSLSYLTWCVMTVNQDKFDLWFLIYDL